MADLINKFKFYQEMNLWPRTVKLNYVRWLENFKDESDRKIAEQILDFFVYYSDDLVNQLLIAVIGKCGYKLQQKYSDWTHDKFKKEVYYSYVPGESRHPTDSGNLFSRKLRDELHIPESQIKGFEELSDLMYRRDGMKVILVDDFVGTGFQCRNAWTKPASKKPGSYAFGDIARAGNHDVYYAPLIINHMGYKEITDKCNGLQDVIKDFVNDDGYVIASKAFMNFYMTSLANNICQQEDSKALLTDLTYTSDLTCTMMTNSPNKKMGEELLKQGVMYKLLISGLKIDPRTPADKLIKFREDYKGERDLFKYEIDELIRANNVEGLPVSEVINQIERIYKMKVLPSVNQLKRALDGRGIDYLENEGTNIMLTGVSVLDPSGAGLSTFWWKALKEIGLSILKKTVKINKEKEKILLGSPYSYLYRTHTYGFSRAGR